MDEKIEKLIEKARRQGAIDDELKKLPFFQNTIALLGFVRLLYSNRTAPREVEITLDDALRAGELEPRVLEVLPGLLLRYPRYVAVDHMPDDLREVMEAIRAGKRGAELPAFRWVTPDKYGQWLQEPPRG